MKVYEAVQRISTGRSFRLAHEIEYGMPMFPGASPPFAIERLGDAPDAVPSR